MQSWRRILPLAAVQAPVLPVGLALPPVAVPQALVLVLARAPVLLPAAGLLRVGLPQAVLPQAARRVARPRTNRPIFRS